MRQSNAALRNTSCAGLRLAAVAAPYPYHHLRCKSTTAKNPIDIKSYRAPTQIQHSNDPTNSKKGRFVSDVTINTEKPLLYIKTSTVRGIVPDLNSTRPPPLDLPTPPHPLAWPSRTNLDPKNWDFKYLFALGKAYGRFYWAGIKQVWANVKTMSAIRRRIQNERYPSIYTYLQSVSAGGKTPATGENSRPSNAAALPIVTYNEWEFLERVRRDTFKLLPFSLIVLVCGEFTPLVVLLFGSRVVPGTCVIPKQEAADLRKTVEREDTFLSKAADFISVRVSDRQWKATDEDGKINRMDVAAAEAQRQNWLLLQAYRLNLCPAFALNLPPFLRNLYLRLRLNKKIVKHSTHYIMAAYHIQSEGGWSKRSPRDMFEFGNAYGLHSLRAYTKEALESGKEIVNDDLKKALLPIFEAETRALLQPDVINELHGVAALQQPHMKQTPDSIALMQDLFKRANVPSSKLDSDVRKRLAAELTGTLVASPDDLKRRKQ